MRLALFSTLISTALWVVLSAWVYLSLRHGLLGEVDASIHSVAEQIVATLAVPEQAVSYHAIAEALATRRAGARPTYVQVVSDADRVVETSEELEGAPIPVQADILAAARQRGEVVGYVDFHDERIRMISMAVRSSPADRRVVQVGMALTPVKATLRRTLWVLLLGSPLVLLLAGLAGVLLAGRALAPIAAIAAQAQVITATNLRQHLAVQYPDELGALAATLNAMFDRLDEAFRATEDAYRHLRRFSADASHELRTPLTALRGEADVALRQPRTAEEYREALEHVLKSAERMSRIVEDLLLLARADAEEVELLSEPVQLDLLLREVVETSLPLAQQKEVHLAGDGFPPVEVVADETYLFRLFANLVDNGIRYTPPGGAVTVTLHEVEGQAVVAVSDTGVGIAPEHLPHIFERFYRVDKARSREHGGSGLGLAVTAWIAAAHRAQLTVVSAPGQGSRFTLTMLIGPR
ncbi:MAG: HAMP domain-containing protein [Armatimonadetes bacterium]|nr:HAMP domain-containing protein [Armatimonadota bacterium]